METVQVVLDRPLLEATDRAAKRLKQNRSALVREALQAYLHGLEVRQMEDRDRAGYMRSGQLGTELTGWEAEAVWPAE
ncbi:ribbon-helix-helix domain-containing protein [Telmatobacter bradus]|uniref:ribbon-helix-helix domain-containing protein n=1 Tax=Telmatobacter bradus TaxID=474953 RepID=UPI003B4396D0